MKEPLPRAPFLAVPDRRRPFPAGRCRSCMPPPLPPPWQPAASLEHFGPRELQLFPLTLPPSMASPAASARDPTASAAGLSRSERCYRVATSVQAPKTSSTRALLRATTVRSHFRGTSPTSNEPSSPPRDVPTVIVAGMEPTSMSSASVGVGYSCAATATFRRRPAEAPAFPSRSYPSVAGAPAAGALASRTWSRASHHLIATRASLLAATIASHRRPT